MEILLSFVAVRGTRVATGGVGRISDKNRMPEHA